MTDLPARLIAYGVLLAVFAGAATTAWVTITGWRQAAERLPQVEREYQAYRTTIEGYVKGDAQARKEYQDDRAATIRVRGSVPVQPVRLRNDGAGRCEPAAPRNAAAVGAPAAPARELPDARGLPDPGGEGPDIAPRLYGLWDEADDLRDDFASCQRDLQRLKEAWPQCPPALPERRRWWRFGS